MVIWNLMILCETLSSTSHIPAWALAVFTQHILKAIVIFCSIHTIMNWDLMCCDPPLLASSPHSDILSGCTAVHSTCLQSASGCAHSGCILRCPHALHNHNRWILQTCLPKAQQNDSGKSQDAHVAKFFFPITSLKCFDIWCFLNWQAHWQAVIKICFVQISCL